MAEQSHQSDPRILGRRTLENNHRRLAAVLRRGMSVLDVGCGVGSITAGIAEAVAPLGTVVGIDRDASLIEIARREYAHVPGLRFDVADVLSLSLKDTFDVVTAARALQWISDPGRALSRMVDVTEPGGHVIVLDYNHTDSSWRPEPPLAFRRFYAAFLHWREANRWINQTGDALPDLFLRSGLRNVVSSAEDEVTERGSPGWREDAAIWLHVVETIGKRMEADGFLAEQDRAEAQSTYRDWIETSFQRQTLVLRGVVGRR